MSVVPQQVVDAWQNRNPAAVFVTVGENGMPNAIYASCVRIYNNSQFVIADNYFDKTRHNLESSRYATLLFITGENKSYQVKGYATRHTEGEAFDYMKQWNDPKHPGIAAVVLDVKEVYSGKEKIV